MLSLYEILLSGKTSTAADTYNLQAGRAFFPQGFDDSAEHDYIRRGGKIIYYTGNGEKPAVPEKLGGESVVSIGIGAFAGSKIKRVKIPYGVEAIE